ncbi:FMN-dependent oxidoreductase (nitrilotriacetate monooxygenase family) [Phyllobacterium sp. 1468]|uniref:LLM class flavin-dependent oxidoreductase n=1 Tax=Phyllobacterium sp. 1468 TaxID=2817759 RepID=UPI00285B58E6|nr:LLM class flavin-dependent oxidoreductase [Phyllobacterium sp. 1468]MDR6635458.1 FMN-dependent oxidoreductase (nitrilotriacetate monooxygenase family) [Phyllobacterium sp. 1468]
MSRQLHLNLFVNGRGHHETAWRHSSSSPLALTDIRYYEDLARRAEAALFDAVFFADVLAIGEGVEFSAAGKLEPLTTLAALARATENIGLIATASTTYTQPFNLARQFASLDHISNGRVGWNIVTSWAGGAGPNFGYDRQIEHAERYERAFEFVDVVTKLWDSWADDAVIDDRDSGRYADPSRITPVDYNGKWHSVRGPLNISRGPQGRPVFVQAGSSQSGRHFAAAHAEAVFTAHLEKATAIEFYKDLKTQARTRGRDIDQLVILPGISPTIGSTEEEAQRTERELNELSEPSVGLARLSNRFSGYDFSHLNLDTVLSVDDFPDPLTVQAARSRAETILALVARERPTLRALLHSLAGARGHFATSGTPEQIARIMEDWFRSGAADGFNVMPPILPTQFDLFVSEVVPLLQSRGLFRRSYSASTLRGHLGLDRPESQYFKTVRPEAIAS